MHFSFGYRHMEQKSIHKRSRPCFSAILSYVFCSYPNIRFCYIMIAGLQVCFGTSSKHSQLMELKIVLMSPLASGSHKREQLG